MSAPALTAPDSAGYPASTPLSMTATVTPAPVVSGHTRPGSSCRWAHGCRSAAGTGCSPDSVTFWHAPPWETVAARALTGHVAAAHARIAVSAPATARAALFAKFSIV